MANFHDLPQEIIRKIFEFASFGVHYPDLRVLCALSVVHSSWRAEAQSLMTRELDLVPLSVEQIRRGKRGFSKNGPNGWFTQSLGLTQINSNAVLDLLDKARPGGVKKLVLREMILDDKLLAHSSLSALESVSLSALTSCSIAPSFVPPRSLTHLHVDSFNAAHSLVVVCAPNLRSIRVGLGTEADCDRFTAQTSRLVRLVQLELVGAWETNERPSWLVEKALELTASLPGIKSLQLPAMSLSGVRAFLDGLNRNEPLARLETTIHVNPGQADTSTRSQAQVTYLGLVTFLDELMTCATSPGLDVIREWVIDLLDVGDRSLFEKRELWSTETVDQWAKFEKALQKQGVKLVKK